MHDVGGLSGGDARRTCKFDASIESHVLYNLGCLILNVLKVRRKKRKLSAGTIIICPASVTEFERARKSLCTRRRDAWGPLESARTRELVLLLNDFGMLACSPIRLTLRHMKDCSLVTKSVHKKKKCSMFSSYLISTGIQLFIQHITFIFCLKFHRNHGR